MVAVILYAIGGAFEFGGIALAAFEILSERRDAKQFADRTLEWDPEREQFRRSLLGKAVSFATIGTPREMENELYQRDDDLRAVVLRAMVGTVRLRACGVALLLAGVVLSAVANVLNAG